MKELAQAVYLSTPIMNHILLVASLAFFVLALFKTGQSSKKLSFIGCILAIFMPISDIVLTYSSVKKPNITWIITVFIAFSPASILLAIFLVVSRNFKHVKWSAGFAMIMTVLSWLGIKFLFLAVSD